MHFLITNDDGIGAPGLKALGDAVLKRGHRLTVCAPATQQSAASQHLTIDKPLLVRSRPWPGAEAWALEGTPADCARIGLQLAAEPADFVLSGINNGLNAGSAVYYSGTFSAAREAAMAHRRAMAVSIDVGATEKMLAALGERAVRLAERLEDEDFPRAAVLNLNAPALPPAELKEMRLAPLSDAFYEDGYEKRESPRGQIYFWLEGGLKMEPHRPDTDLALLAEGYPTLSVVTGFRDDQDWLEARNWRET